MAGGSFWWQKYILWNHFIKLISQIKVPLLYVLLLLYLILQRSFICMNYLAVRTNDCRKSRVGPRVLKLYDWVEKIHLNKMHYEHLFNQSSYLLLTPGQKVYFNLCVCARACACVCVWSLDIILPDLQFLWYFFFFFSSFLKIAFKNIQTHRASLDFH